MYLHILQAKGPYFQTPPMQNKEENCICKRPLSWDFSFKAGAKMLHCHPLHGDPFVGLAARRFSFPNV